MGKVKELEALGYNFGCCITEPVSTLGRRLEAAGQLMSAKKTTTKKLDLFDSKVLFTYMYVTVTRAKTSRD